MNKPERHAFVEGEEDDLCLTCRGLVDDPIHWLVAPFTPEQVARLTEWQNRGTVHPFTCENRGDPPHPPDAVLVATADGWVCPHCPYTQKWAHAFMAYEREGDGYE